MARSQELQAKKNSDTIEKLKKDRRRMDELITMKEGKIEQLELHIREIANESQHIRAALT